jgi:hypothetical protein
MIHLRAEFPMSSCNGSMGKLIAIKTYNTLTNILYDLKLSRRILYDLKLSRRINVLTSSRAIRRVSVQLENNVSEVSSVSIIRVDMVNKHTSQIWAYIPVCRILQMEYNREEKRVGAFFLETFRRNNNYIESLIIILNSKLINQS